MTNRSEHLGLVRHEDIVQPFMLHKSSVRGRLVRMGSTIDEILARKKNHPAVNRLVGEMLTLAAMLSSNLPENGILTMQAKGDGPVSMLVADATHGGALRGYAGINEDIDLKTILADIDVPDDEVSLKHLMGEGYLAITLDMGKGDPYQGIVALEGKSLSDAVQQYFTQSQQIDVLFKISVNKRVREDGTSRWRAGGIMLEQMPEVGGNALPKNEIEQEEADQDKEPNDTGIKGWHYNALIVDTISEDELLDPHLAASALLYHLFSEAGVWVGEASPVLAECRCSRDKITNVLSAMSKETLEEMKVDGEISVVCQFCNMEELFSDEHLSGIN